MTLWEKGGSLRVEQEAGGNKRIVISGNAAEATDATETNHLSGIMFNPRRLIGAIMQSEPLGTIGGEVIVGVAYPIFNSNDGQLGSGIGYKNESLGGSQNGG